MGCVRKAKSLPLFLKNMEAFISCQILCQGSHAPELSFSEEVFFME